MSVIRHFLTLMAFVISFALFASPAFAEGMNGVVNACKTKNMELLSVDEEGALGLHAGAPVTHEGRTLPIRPNGNIWDTCEELVLSDVSAVRSDTPIARPQAAAKAEPVPVVAPKAAPTIATAPVVKTPLVVVAEPVVPTETVNAYDRAAHRGQHTGGTGLIRPADELVRNTNRPAYYDPPIEPASVFMEILKSAPVSATAYDDAHRIKAWIEEILQPLLTDTKRAGKTASWVARQQDGVQNAAAWATSALPSLPEIKGYARSAMAWTMNPIWHLIAIIVGVAVAGLGIRIILVERDYRLHPEKYDGLPKEPDTTPGELWIAVENELAEVHAMASAQAPPEEDEGSEALTAINCNDPEPISYRERALR